MKTPRFLKLLNPKSLLISCMHTFYHWYLREVCGGSHHTCPYGPSGRYIVLMNEDQYNRYTFLARDDSAKRELSQLRAKLKTIYDATECYADGAEDATAHDKLANEITNLAKLNA